MTSKNRQLISQKEFGEISCSLYDTGALTLARGINTIATLGHSELLTADERDTFVRCLSALYFSPAVIRANSEILSFELNHKNVELVKAVLASQELVAEEKALVCYAESILNTQIAPEELIKLAKTQKALSSFSPESLLWQNTLSYWLTPFGSLLENMTSEAEALFRQLMPFRFKVATEYTNFLSILNFLAKTGDQNYGEWVKTCRELTLVSLTDSSLAGARLAAKLNIHEKINHFDREQIHALLACLNTSTETLVDFLCERIADRSYPAAYTGEVIIDDEYSTAELNRLKLIMTRDEIKAFLEHESRYGIKFWEVLSRVNQDTRLALMAIIAKRGASDTEEIIIDLTKTDGYSAAYKLDMLLRKKKDYKKFLALASEENLEIPPVWATIVVGLNV